MKKNKVVFGLAAAVFVAVAFRLFICFSPYPELNDFFSLPKSTRIYDCNNELIQVLSLENGLRREFVPLEKMPSEVCEIFIRAEDKNFYAHFGIDLLSVCRAAFQNIKSGRTVSGASTITMQLARMIKKTCTIVRQRRFSAVEKADNYSFGYYSCSRRHICHCHGAKNCHKLPAI